MSLIVEDGTGKSNAESYCSVAFCDDYFSKRGNTTWGDLDDDAKEAALRNASEYMVGTYRDRWLGRRVLTTQRLDWPRVGVIISDFRTVVFGAYGLFQVDYQSVPEDIKRACAELAIRATVGVLAVDQEQSVIRETIGPITVEYQPNTSSVLWYRQVDMILKVYLANGGSGSMVRLSRT
jgi:hypothetical protein